MNMLHQPLVSIGIPYYNAERYILETLESVKAQTYPSIELLLINDCSPDNSHAVVTDWVKQNNHFFSNIIVVENSENRGVAYSCRVLQKAAHGEFFTKLDADDTILPFKTTEQVTFLLANLDVAMVYSNTLLMRPDSSVLEENYFEKQKFEAVKDNKGPGGQIFSELLAEDFIPASSVMIRKCVLDAVGGYDESLYIEDWDMWLRIARNNKIEFINRICSLYRVHPQSMMQKKESLMKVYGSLIVALLKHKNISKEYDKIIAKHIYTYSIGMYRFGKIDMPSLRINLSFNKNVRSLMYYLFGLLNIKINQKVV